MEEKKTIQQQDLEKVSGGLDTVFYGDIPICPVCGERPIQKVSGDEYVDTYKCHVCGKTSIHIKKERPVPYPGLVCQRCGSLGKWAVLRSENGMDTIQCTVCRLERVVPTEQS